MAMKPRARSASHHTISPETHDVLPSWEAPFTLEEPQSRRTLDTMTQSVQDVVEREKQLAAPPYNKGEHLFDHSQVFRDANELGLPDPDRYDPPRGVPKKWERALSDRKLLNRTREAVERGVTEHGDKVLDWYGSSKGLLDAFGDHYKGPGSAKDAFLDFMKGQAASSPQTTVQKNVENGSYFYTKQHDLPAAAADIPDKYRNGVSTNTVLNLVQKIYGDGIDPHSAPKVASFGANLSGNLNPVTIDAHKTRPFGMLRQDPEFLSGSIGINDPETNKFNYYNPKKEFEAGNLTMREALERPTFWQSRPDKTAYKAIEDHFRTSVAERMGLLPAQAQAAEWYGNQALTGVKTKPETWLTLFEKELIESARSEGLTQQEALKRLINRERPLAEVPVNPFTPTQPAPDDEGKP